MNKKKIFAIFMIFVTMVAFMQPVEIGASADLRRQLENMRQERDQARSEVHDARGILSGMRGEIDALLEIMAAYSQRTMDAQADLEEVEFILQETELLIAYTEIELAQAREELAAHNELFRARLRAMHEQGPVGYLEVLFQATSFTELLIGLEHVRSIAQADRQVLEYMAVVEERVASRVDDLNDLLGALQDLHDEMQGAIDALNEAVAAQEAMLAEMYEDEAQAALLYEIAVATERAIQEMFGTVEVQLRAAEAEEARQRREAELRRQQQEQANRLAHLNDPSRDFLWPIPTHSHISSPFGSRRSPIHGRNEHHTGIDVPAPSGTRILAAADGYVRLSAWNGGFGNTVIIDHGNGYSTLYAHNSRNRVTVGQRVNRGDHIADVGTTGQSTGNHLHFEIRRNGTPIDPMQFFR